ncbi:MAG TPA: N-acetylmuramoyl-L-alanine amidase [Nevskiaceae bacterium]
MALLLLAASAAHAGQLLQVQLLPRLCAPGSVRAVLSLSTTPDVQLFTMNDPARLVVDLHGVHPADAVRRPSYRDGVIDDLRFGVHRFGTRIVFDLRRPVHFSDFMLAAAPPFARRLVINLTPASAAASRDRARLAHASFSPCGPHPAPAAAPRAVALVPVSASSARPFVVAVDPGHGGIDPGAHGPDGLDEKIVTLAVGRDLARLIDRQPGMEAVLTRSGDYYVPLQTRVAIARKAGADIFISIHCNASTDPAVHGTAVYMLSPHGASNVQAQRVADRENAADTVGGVELRDMGGELASTLVSIAQSASLDASADLAGQLLHAMAQISPVWEPHVQRANFVVLRALAIPSVLVETDFITNPHEERLLGSPRYQERVAGRLLRGVESYYRHYQPHEHEPFLSADAVHRSAAAPLPRRRAAFTR